MFICPIKLYSVDTFSIAEKLKSVLKIISKTLSRYNDKYL